MASTASVIAEHARLALILGRPMIFWMCNRFQCDASFTQLAKLYSATPVDHWEYGGDIVPGDFAAGLLVTETDQRALHPMQFGIAPPNCETSLHPTFDHSLADITEANKWPWLKSIGTSRCVVPISAFHICSYWGDPEGTEIYFHRIDKSLLHVAGVYRIWKSSSSERRVTTMSFLTRPASDYVMDHGSDRQPIFITTSGIDPWMDPRTTSSDEAIQTLRRHSIDPDLTHRHHRDLPAGWRKHQKQKTRRRGQTMAAQERCPYACGF